MGREIRRVPPNWKHPTDANGDYLPLHDETYEEAAKRWLANCVSWANGMHPDLIEDPAMKDKFPFYWEWEGNPPDKNDYRPAFEEEPTWFQMYETVSDGSPVTPPFATKEEIADYLVEHGEFFDTRGPWPREAAEQFIEREWAPSLMVEHYPETIGTRIYEPRTGFPNRKE